MRSLMFLGLALLAVTWLGCDNQTRAQASAQDSEAMAALDKYYEVIANPESSEAELEDARFHVLTTKNKPALIKQMIGFMDRGAELPLQSEFAKHEGVTTVGAFFHLVLAELISVDQREEAYRRRIRLIGPAFDTPGKMAEYAEKHEYDLDRMHAHIFDYKTDDLELLYSGQVYSDPPSKIDPLYAMHFFQKKIEDTAVMKFCVEKMLTRSEDMVIYPLYAVAPPEGHDGFYNASMSQHIHFMICETLYSDSEYPLAKDYFMHLPEKLKGFDNLAAYAKLHDYDIEKMRAHRDDSVE